MQFESLLHNFDIFGPTINPILDDHKFVIMPSKRPPPVSQPTPSISDYGTKIGPIVANTTTGTAFGPGITPAVINNTPLPSNSTPVATIDNKISWMPILAVGGVLALIFFNR